MSQSITIRKATEADANTIIEFNIDMAMETENRTLKRDDIEPGVKSLFAKSQYGYYLVAEDRGKVIASLMVTFEWSDWRNGLFWWIQSVYVRPGYRRQGVYRRMYAAVKQMGDAEPDVCGYRLYVEKENTIAQKTYERLGMDETHYKMFEEIK
jgi:ribosomal protein S18 acetylase RimI-like enzyme